MKVPIRTLHLFPGLDEKLIELLKSLRDEEWNLPSVAKKWTVKDITAHLLDGNFRLLSMVRDHYFGDPPGAIQSYQDLLDYLNNLNATWVAATKRLSPAVLIGLLETSGKEYHNILQQLDPFDTAMFSVAWAGEAESKNWFHIAREYTEKWHHQQQIRDAVNKPGIMEREFYFPLIDTFMCALPHTYRNTAAPEHTHVKVNVTSEAGGSCHWYEQRMRGFWHHRDRTPSAEITLEPDTAWKLFTKALRGEEDKAKIHFSGKIDLCQPVLSMLAVMA